MFIGFANFYRRFIAGFSRIAAPLTNLLKGGSKGKFSGLFCMTDEAVQAFKSLKCCFTCALMLRYFDPALLICLETDALGYAIAGILSQTNPESTQKHWHLIAF